MTYPLSALPKLMSEPRAPWPRVVPVQVALAVPHDPVLVTPLGTAALARTTPLPCRSR